MAEQIILEITDLETGEVELSTATVIESAEQLEALFAQHKNTTDDDAVLISTEIQTNWDART